MSETPTIEQQVHEAASRFERTFGAAPSHAALAPGRVNLIGEHTDYNDGFVLPMAIERQTVMVGRPRTDHQAHVVSTAFEEPAQFAVDPLLKPGKPPWANYIRGVVAGYLNKHINPGGFDALMHSSVPTGGGLSSSASIEVAAATLIEALAGPKHEPLTLIDKALVCQRAEHEFAGMPCGVMDQFISSLAQADHALLIDCRSHEVEEVPMIDPNLAVLIINTNCQHELIGGEYAQRRSQCEAAAKVIGVPALRDATQSQLQRHKDELDQVSFRRARHVISENRRTLEAAKALRNADWPRVGRLMFESHASLRDDFEVSTPELDTLVELAEEHALDARDSIDGQRDNSGDSRSEATRSPQIGGVIGSRMTGGGFGGCSVSLVHADHAQALTQAFIHEYHQRTGIEPTAFITRPAAGARLWPLA